MTSHLFKLIYNQRRSNGWSVLELFLIFILIWVLVDFFSVLYLTARTPVGADITDTYLVKLSMTPTSSPSFIAYEEGSEEPSRNFQRIVDRIRNHPDIECLCLGQYYYPYYGGSSSTTLWNDTLKTAVNVYHVTKDYFRVFRLYGLNGETPQELGERLGEKVILTRLGARRLFPGDISPAGKRVYWDEKDSIGSVVMAVLPDMKQHEYTRPFPVIISLMPENSWGRMSENRLFSRIGICFRLRSNADRQAFEASFKDWMQMDAGNYSFSSIVPFSQVRQNLLDMHKISETIQYRVLLTVFFLLNLFLGVIGTFWFRIEYRREELGLRMALGASRRKIQQWLLWESVCLFAVAFVPALLVCLNIYRMDLLATENMDLTAGRFLLDVALSLLLLLPVILLATWYPARRSAKIEPAEALHYE